jgi:hypothetical protein
MATLAAGLKAHAVQVLIIDPLYEWHFQAFSIMIPSTPRSS